MTSNQAYRLEFKQIGQDVIIWPLAKIVFPEVICIGDSVIIDDFVFIMGGGGISIGSFVHIASFASITGGGELLMADFSAISSGARVFTGNEDYSGNSLTNPTVPAAYRHVVRGRVRIEKHAVIGANAVVLPGVTIGEGVVVSPNSVVIADCAPWTVYVGNPARPVKERPNERMLDYERRVREEAYSPEGLYVPAALRGAPRRG